MKFNIFFLAIGVFFGAFAGLMTFLISYNELVKHFATKNYPRKIALRTAIGSFLFFLVLSCVLGYIISFLIIK